MDSKFDIDDLVEFEGQVYRVVNIYFLNPQIPTDPFVCKLISIENKSDFLAPVLLIRESLLEKFVEKT